MKQPVRKTERITSIDHNDDHMPIRIGFSFVDFDVYQLTCEDCWYASRCIMLLGNKYDPMSETCFFPKDRFMRTDDRDKITTSRKIYKTIEEREGDECHTQE
jgi:hypothetical protein